MCTRQELNTILTKMVHIYQSVYGPNIVRILLYGSYARGENHSDSDIDIVAIVKGERPSLQADLPKIWDQSSDLELQYDTILSPTVIPFNEFEKYKNVLPYYRNIENEGVVIHAE